MRLRRPLHSTVEAAVVVVHMVEVAVVRTAVVAEAVATRAEVPEAVDRMPVLRAHPPVDPMRAAGALAQMRVITEAGIGGIRFMAVPLRAEGVRALALPVRVLRRDRTRVPSALRVEIILGRTRLRAQGMRLEA
ncbi:MAG: hypothetical protein WAN14_22495 [Candidatus Acidiferrales bacterium]